MRVGSGYLRAFLIGTSSIAKASSSSIEDTFLGASAFDFYKLATHGAIRRSLE